MLQARNRMVRVNRAHYDRPEVTFHEAVVVVLLARVISRRVPQAHAFSYMSHVATEAGAYGVERFFLR